ncbi:glycosyl transferase, group 1 [Acidovorax sp. JS42]|nr:glycosyl transferase, group 1 [Acidovorax sp. JS42]
MNNKKLRIAHICQAASYTEGMLYQDNVLPDLNRVDGHEVLIVADCTCYVNGKLTTVPEEDKNLENGIRLVRLEFGLKFLPNIIRNKIRYAPKLKKLLEAFQPDVILYHSLVGAGLLTVGDYKKKYPKTRLYLDSHADFNNSGSSFFSRWLQYKIFNRFLWVSISGSVEKVFYLSSECRDFLREMYKIEESRMEFFPLGGFVQDEEKRRSARSRVRQKHSLSEDNIVFIHTGKMNKLKRTLDVINSFSTMPYENYRLWLVGTFEDDIAQDANRLISKDQRIKYLGWKSGEELIDFLSASDCYLQPGSQSATLQTAICCGLPVIVYPHASHFAYIKNNGFFVKTSKELSEALSCFKNIEKNSELEKASLEVANNILDYRKLANRLYW